MTKRILLRSYGFVDVLRETTAQHDHIHIEYGGNMGNTIESVEKLVDEMYGPRTFLKLRSVAHVETGSPDYLYTLVVDADQFFKLIKHEDYLFKNRVESQLAGNSC